MSRVASSIIEVKDGTVVNYHGNYESYLTWLTKKSTTQRKLEPAKHPPALTPKKGKGKEDNKSSTPKSKNAIVDDRVLRKEISNLEKTNCQTGY